MSFCKQYTLLIGVMIVVTLANCKKRHGSDPDSQLPNSVPQVTTSPVTNITTSTAVSGGTINSNGGEVITASGICYSKTNPMPGLTDDTTKGPTATGSFISYLNNLNFGTTYYIRAYATNSKGTGYGNVVSFTTNNGVPNVPPIALGANNTRWHQEH